VTVRAVFFDVGETLVDEERIWREVARVAGLAPHVVWAALGKTIERGEDHWSLWRHLGVERPEGVWERHGYVAEDLFPDVATCLERLRTAGMFVGVAGNQSETMERWARAALPVDVVTSSAGLGGASRIPRSSSASSSWPASLPARWRTWATAQTTTRGRRSPQGSSRCTSAVGRGGCCRQRRRVRSRSRHSTSSRLRSTPRVVPRRMRALPIRRCRVSGST
jgi:hypothetical protein